MVVVRHPETRKRYYIPQRRRHSGGGITVLSALGLGELVGLQIEQDIGDLEITYDDMVAMGFGLTGTVILNVG